MRVSVTFRHMEPTDAIKEYVEKKLAKVKRYLDEPIEAAAVLSVEKYRNIAEVTLSVGRSVINCTEETDDIYTSIDKAVDKLDRQVKRQRDKVRTKKGRAKVEHEAFVAEAEALDEGAEHRPEWEKRIAATERASLKPISIEEAVLWMDANPTRDFLVFTDVGTAGVHVMYRRRDGEFGLIQATNE